MPSNNLNTNDPQAAILTLVRNARERQQARLLIESLHAFGGALSRCPIWLYEAIPQVALGDPWEDLGVQVFALNVPDVVRDYLFADKVFACAQAEAMAPVGLQTLIWIDPVCLVVQPPVLYDLGEAFDAALRPVHIKNVGLHCGEPLDAYWCKICEIAGIDDIPTTVETFVGRQRIRAYYNTHAFAINPANGLLGRWARLFEALVRDREFQREACPDIPHQVFLHQAIWSALLVAELDPERVCLLPPEYNYPYNLHASVPEDRRAAALNDLVSIAYEERSLDPAQAADIEVREPLRSWLADRAGFGLWLQTIGKL